MNKGDWSVRFAIAMAYLSASLLFAGIIDSHPTINIHVHQMVVTQQLML
jgi:hypothetical protein